ncbi:hypothetical protein JHK87_034214 [Glycine soja]|nr:hypothetical protein JHK87_034214 [Glycine soja]
MDSVDWEAVHKSVKLLKPSNLVDNTTLLQEGYSYMLPDKHPLLAECIPRELDDPSPYLLVEWTTGDLESSCESTKNNLQEEENSLTVPGTLLVFADHTSIIHPINVPRKWLWNLEKRIVYFGTGVSSIMRGLSMMRIRDCFWSGFICVRAMDAKTKASRPI